MNIRVDNFHGIQPRLHPSLLANGMAVRAHNVKLKSGKLVPIRQPLKMSSAKSQIYLENGLARIGDAKTLYPWKHATVQDGVRVDFLAFPGIVSVAQGNLADDQYDRLFVTGKTGIPFTDADDTTWNNSPAIYFFSQTANAISRMTMCKNALAAPSVSLASGESVDTDKTIYYVNFFASWVDKFGLESGLSPASNATGSAAYGDVEPKPLTLNSGSTVQFDAINVPSAATKVYVYVSAAGTSESSDGIQFFCEVSANAARAGFTYVYNPELLGETEPGIESPPGDLAGIRYVDGGFYAAFSPSSPHTVMFSDVGIVTSWPTAYRYDVKDNIVALATTSNSVFALTDGYPWVLSGTAPETMTAARLAGPAACVSPRSVVVYKNSVYYASNEGMMVIANSADAGTVCANLTDKIFTKDQWLDLGPETCIAGQFDGALHLFFDGKDGLRIDLAESANAVTTHDERASCMCVDDRDDKLYFVRNVEVEGGA